MSSILGVEKSLELLDRLKGAVQDFAAREQKLNHESRLKSSRDRQQSDEAAAREQERLAAETAEADAAFESARRSAESKYEGRKSRISQARSRSKEQAQERIESRTGSRKYELQKKLLDAERDRDNRLANLATEFEEFRNNLASEDASLQALETEARKSFRAYGKFRRLLSQAFESSQPDLVADETQLIAALRDLQKQAHAELDGVRALWLPKVFACLPLWLVILLCLVPMLPFVLARAGINSLPAPYSLNGGIAIAACLFVGLLALRVVATKQVAPHAPKVAEPLGKARRLHNVCVETFETLRHQKSQGIKEACKNISESIDLDLKQALKENLAFKGTFRERIDNNTVRANERNERIYRAKLKQIEGIHAESLARIKQESAARSSDLTGAASQAETKSASALHAAWQALEADWKSTIEPIYAAVNAVNSVSQKLFPPWDRKVIEEWTPPPQFEQAAKFARLEVDLNKLAEGIPQNQRLALPGPSCFSLPLLLAYPNEGSILLETSGAARDVAINALNNIILRLLSTSAPGRLNFTIVDPVGLGQNFAGVMHLADYEAQIINSRIWTQTAQIEQKLADLNEHMEKVIQMYLRNEYATIADYNEQAGNIAEKYYFLVVADFPVNFSDLAARRLLSIATSGARCGVYTLIHWDRRQPVPQDVVPDQLRKSSVSLLSRGNDFIITGIPIAGADLVLDPSPDPELATELTHRIGRSSRDSSRVEVPFEHVAPPDSEVWTMETTDELRVPIGRTGATKLQYLAIGKGTRQHALIAGKTGSGKSTLFHVIITNLALWSSPEQAEFYLVDFKKGVEFKCYATKHLPHARVVAIESDREFGLSVLQRVDDELKRRGDLFRKLGVQDIPGYKRAGGTEPIPRSLLMIDEFQEFFVEDDKISQTASVLLDRIVRQGRAFGIHVILGSQTLGGAYTLARTTIGQMVIRIALQCNEADAYLIMDESNPAPRLLSRPGEGIYNDSAGSVEGNSPFQVVWLPDEVRDAALKKVRARADQAATTYPGPVVFEGNAPSDVRENLALQTLLQAPAAKPPLSPSIWLGAPNSIKGPTEAVFHRQSGNHLLVVGQREEAAMAIMSVALISLAAQYPVGAARFVLLDGNPPGTPQRAFLDRVVAAIPHPVAVAKPNDLADLLNSLADDLAKRADAATADAPPAFLFIHGLQKFNKLRHEEDFSFSADDAQAASPGARLNQLICDGASQGIHIIATCDTYNNVNRFLGRKAFGEFELRVLFQMSVNDSASLIDSPKASTLGLHRALFFNEQEGYLETFRPYALPDNEWLDQTARDLTRLLAH